MAEMTKRTETVMVEIGDGFWQGVEIDRDLFVPTGISEGPRCCVTCHREAVPVGGDWHDACIAQLPCVKYACCGHGVPTAALKLDVCYVMFDDDTVLRENAARGAMMVLGGEPPPRHPDTRQWERADCPRGVGSDEW